MKKKAVSLLLAITMTALMLTGCATGETTREIMENQVEETEEPEVIPEEIEEAAAESEEEKEAVEWTKEEWQESIYEDYRDAIIRRTEPILSEEVMENIDWDEDLLPYLKYDWLEEEGLWIGTLTLSYAEFSLADLNEDGQRELTITLSDHREPGITYIYTVIDGKVVFCGETLASMIRYDVADNVKAIPYFPEDLFDVYKDPDGRYRLISYGYGDLHGNYGGYYLFESVYDNEQITYIPAFGTMYEGYDDECTYSYWIEKNGNGWKEVVGEKYVYTNDPDGLYKWMIPKYNVGVVDDKKYTALIQLLSEQYADYEKIDVTFEYSPYIVSGDVCVYYDADQEAVRYNIRAGLAIAAGLAEAE
ncbi:MAG: hypothetical protein J1E61_08775 [Lachnospiraceae bacterium]|nr:hypothetical protein [Lachnospiraceae bacterium]